MSPTLEKTLEKTPDQGEHDDESSSGVTLKGGMDSLEVSEDPVQDGDGGGEGAADRLQRNKEALQRLNIDDAVKSLILSQIQEAPVPDEVDGQLMDLLQKCLEREQRRSSVVALSGYIEHFESRSEEDLGWGCGWRNIQMLSSYMLAQNPEVKDVLFGGAGFVPDIFAMQQWLEIAWLKGFDVLGADYFDWKIAGTHKWIGTTECAALLRSFGIRARIIDFRTASSKRGMDSMGGKGGSDSENSDLLPCSFNRLTVGDDVVDEQEGLLYLRQCPENPNFCLTCVEERKNFGASHHVHSNLGIIYSCDSKDIRREQRNDDSSAGGGGSAAHPSDVDFNHKYMTNWIWNYFSVGSAPGEQNSITFSSRSPLYFQHRGHSRTIVGIERCKKEGSNKEEDYLIVLDPSQRTLDLMRSLQRQQGWEELVKRGMRSLNKAEYQLCYIEPGIAKGEELESLKTLSSVRYMY